MGHVVPRSQLITDETTAVLNFKRTAVWLESETEGLPIWLPLEYNQWREKRTMLNLGSTQWREKRTMLNLGSNPT